MIRLRVRIGLRYEIAAPGADFIFHLHPARTAQQAVLDERLALGQPDQPMTLFTDPGTGNRCLRLQGQPGPLTLDYAATVEVQHHLCDPAGVEEVPVAQLPQHVIPYIYPSRYCPSDRLLKLALREFGGLPQGHARVDAVRDWVWRRVTFASNSSNSNTSAIDTLVDQVGVCRDFAHLMIALCRALNIPARFVTGTDYGADPALGPPDFHAYVEAWVGHRWYLFDPSGTALPMGLLRIATGRDAADVAFATIFGSVQTHPPTIETEAIVDGTPGLVHPLVTALALSTHDGWSAHTPVLAA